MRIFKLAQEAYQIAVDHGWHDRPRTPDEVLALILTEAGEAVDEDRKANALVYKGRSGKPEGVAVELADLCIRIMDAAGEFDAIEDLSIGYKTAEKYPNDQTTLTTLVMDIAEVVGEARYCFVVLKNPSNALHTLGWAISFIEDFCKTIKVDLETVIKEKMEFNKGRPHKHGKSY